VGWGRNILTTESRIFGTATLEEHTLSHGPGIEARFELCQDLNGSSAYGVSDPGFCVCCLADEECLPENKYKPYVGKYSARHGANRGLVGLVLATSSSI
jgi:hypothetical protein